ncbi:protein spalt-accessory-like [Drosophila suzukii]|uniref:Protein spalt-accessory-like n=1 Tax=Drosophila suzukii TaxID=28584 RepID=A0ABM4TN30_DROSZ
MKLLIVLFALVGTGFARPGYDGGLNNIESRFGGSVPQSGQGGYGSGQGGYAPSRQGEQIGYSGGPSFQNNIREFGESVPKNGQGVYGGGLSLQGGLGGYGGSVTQSVQRGYGEIGYGGSVPQNGHRGYGGSVPQSGHKGYGQSGQGGYGSGQGGYGRSLPQSGQRGYSGGPSRQVSLGGYDEPVPQSGQEGYGAEFGQAKHDFYHHVHDKHCDHHNHGHY